MKKYLLIKPIVLFAVILLVFIGAASAKAAPPHHPVTYYVNVNATGMDAGTSWQDAYTDLQDALYAAVSGDEIWVAAGTYTPSAFIDTSDTRTAAFILTSGVKIYGGFEGDEKRLKERQLDPSLPSVLSGDIGISGDDTDNSYHVVYANGVTDAVLDGFTVTGGRGDGGGSIYDYRGAGMYNNNSALTVANCTFSDNRVAVTTLIRGYGGGMYNYNSAPIVTNCTFIANQAGNAFIHATGRGGGMYNEGYFVTDENDYRRPLITGCTFSDNVASSRGASGPTDPEFGGGGGMYNSVECSPTVDSCVFERNLGGHGGGMLNYGGYPTITNCIFNANSNTYLEGYGGAIYNLARATIVNCTFYQNGWRLMPEGYTAPRFRPYTYAGGAIYDNTFGSNITNCIFSENTAVEYGGAVSAPHTSLSHLQTTLTYCLFYENKSWQGKYDPAYERTDHVTGDLNPDSVNNLYDIDPLLVDPESGDFHLWYDSPCIDAGYSLKRGYLPYPYPQGLSATDFEGDNRIVDGDGDGGPAVDIGVDEFIPNLPDLRAFLEDLADSGELDEETAARLLDYVDEAQAALDEDEEETAISFLNELVDDIWVSLGDTETAQLIEMKTNAVIEKI